MFGRFLASLVCIWAGAIALYMSLITIVHYGTLAAHVSVIKSLPPVIRSQPLDSNPNVLIIGAAGMAVAIYTLTAGITLFVKAMNSDCCKKPCPETTEES
jgi:hypothetical protein